MSLRAHFARQSPNSAKPQTEAPKVDSAFRSSVKNVFVAGNLLRSGKSVNTADQCMIEGLQAGKSIAQFLR